jgi:tol-pal system protein YbgF
MKRLLMITAIVLVGLMGCALQQDVVVLEDRIAAVEQQNQALKRENDSLQQQLKDDLSVLGQSSQSAEKHIRGQYADMKVNLDSMQQDMRLFNGRLEELEHQLDQKTADSDAVSQKVDVMAQADAKLEQRISQVEQYLNIEQTKQKAAAGGTAAETKPAKQSSDQQIYDDAKKAFDNGEMDRARQGFQQLLKSYPKSENADNAQFWIGESYYHDKWYEKAILEYQNVIEKYPKGNKVPAAMLKQGLAFLQLGDKSNARLILSELQKKYPKSNEARIASQKLKEL